MNLENEDALKSQFQNNFCATLKFKCLPFKSPQTHSLPPPRIVAFGLVVIFTFNYSPPSRRQFTLCPPTFSPFIRKCNSVVVRSVGEWVLSISVCSTNSRPLSHGVRDYGWIIIMPLRCCWWVLKTFPCRRMWDFGTMNKIIRPMVGVGGVIKPRYRHIKWQSPNSLLMFRCVQFYPVSTPENPSSSSVRQFK